MKSSQTRHARKRSRENPKPPAHLGADIGRLLRRLREANARLLVGAIHAQNVSDEARLEAAQARAEVDDLIRQLRSANQRLASGAAEARAMTDEAQARQEDYRQLTGRLLTLQDQERRRLALDLHDSTSQRLAALVMNLDVLGKNRRNLDAGSRRALAASRSLAQQCVREVRTFAHLLHPPLLDEAGLLSALRWFVEGFTRRSGIRVELVLGEVGRLPTAIETALFRVVQESLTNVHRHASRASVMVRLAQSAGTVALDVHDDGRGVGDGQRDANGKRRAVTLGVGIQGMRERIAQLRGTFDVTFSDHGTTVRVRVPLGDGRP